MATKMEALQKQYQEALKMPPGPGRDAAAGPISAQINQLIASGGGDEEEEEEPIPGTPSVNYGPGGTGGGISEGGLGGPVGGDLGPVGLDPQGGSSLPGGIDFSGGGLIGGSGGQGGTGSGVGFPGSSGPAPPGGFTGGGGGNLATVRYGAGGGGGVSGGGGGSARRAIDQQSPFDTFQDAFGPPGTGSGLGGGGGGGGGRGLALDQAVAQQPVQDEELTPGTISGANRLVESYNKAYGEAKSANEARYQQLLGITDETTGQRAADIRGRGEEERADLQQSLARTGLSNTTVSPTLTVGSKRREGEALNRLADQLQGTKLGIIERRTDAFPDPAALQSSLSRLGEGYGSAGMETLFNALANVDQSTSGALPGVAPVQSLQQVALGGTAQASNTLSPAGAAPFNPGGSVGFPGGGFNEQIGTYGKKSPSPRQRQPGTLPTF